MKFRAVPLHRPGDVRQIEIGLGRVRAGPDDPLTARVRA